MDATTSSGDLPATASDCAPSEVAAPVMAACELSLPRSVRAPGLARQALRKWIAGVGCTDELVDNAALLVSEAVTNAVVHAHSQPRLLITIIDDRLRIEIHDDSPAPPACVHHASPAADTDCGSLPKWPTTGVGPQPATAKSCGLSNDSFDPPPDQVQPMTPRSARKRKPAQQTPKSLPGAL